MVYSFESLHVHSDIVMVIEHFHVVCIKIITAVYSFLLDESAVPLLSILLAAGIFGYPFSEY